MQRLKFGVDEEQMRELVKCVIDDIEKVCGVEIQAQAMMFNFINTKTKQGTVMKVGNNKIEFTNECVYLPEKKEVEKDDIGQPIEGGK